MTDRVRELALDVMEHFKFLKEIGCEGAPRGAEEGSALARIRQEMGECTRCPLSRGRNAIVFGAGDLQARLMLVGEAPGEEEDRTGLPFVGAAGKLLTDMLRAIGLSREEVYIANIVKCRPPGNRDPEPSESACCLPFLKAQIQAIRPDVIVTLGRLSSQILGSTSTPITRLRGSILSHEGITLIPTYHPAYLLRNPAAKREAWADLKKVREILNRTAGAASGRRG